MPLDAKPPKSSWMLEEKIRHKIESLECYAIDDCKSDDQRKTAGTVTKSNSNANDICGVKIDLSR